jgi:hypothetical protein
MIRQRAGRDLAMRLFHSTDGLATGGRELNPIILV